MVTCGQIIPNRPTKMASVVLEMRPHQHAKAVKQETRQVVFYWTGVTVLEALPRQGISHEPTTEERLKARVRVFKIRYTSVFIYLGAVERAPCHHQRAG